jgi:predicted transglutaminase-like cysteine proteinase
MLCIALGTSDFIKANTSSYITKEQLEKITKTYNARAGKRLSLWNKMMIKANGLDDLAQLKAVNDYFNRIKYLTDRKHWGIGDYWATAFEFIGSGAGDCEDFATAKYFSLKLLGVEDKKLQLSYVKLKTHNKKYSSSHMVLSYFSTPDAEPILLDNVNLRLKLASERPDIIPIFSFNASSLLKSKHRGKQSKIAQYNLDHWQELINK